MLNKSIKYTMKSGFFKVLPILIFFVLYNGIMITFSYEEYGDIYACVYTTLEGAFVYFAFFLIYAYFSILKFSTDGMEELVSAIDHYRRDLFTVIALLIYNAIASILIVFVNIIFLTSYDNFSLEIAIHIFRLVVLNFTLGGSVAIIAGTIFARIKSIKLQLSLIVVFLVLISPFIQSENDFGCLNPFFDFFSFLPRNIGMGVIPYAGYSVSMDEWVHYLLIATIFIIIYLVQNHNKKVNRYICGFMIVGILLFVTYLIPHTIMGEDRIRSKYVDYYDLNISKEEKADFNIYQYDADIKICGDMWVCCKMNIDNSQAQSYKFTLLHEFKIDTIEDQDGNKLQYKRDGDYIEIFGKNIKSITICYKGLPEGSYIDTEAFVIALGKPYVPYAGYIKVYEDGYIPNEFSNEPLFNINISCMTKVHSNLKECGDNSFSGSSNSVILYGGFVNSITIDDVTVYYSPYAAEKKEKLNAIEKTIKEYLALYESGKVDYDIRNKKIFETYLYEYSTTSVVETYKDYIQTTDILNLLQMEEQ